LGLVGVTAVLRRHLITTEPFRNGLCTITGYTFTLTFPLLCVVGTRVVAAVVGPPTFNFRSRDRYKTKSVAQLIMLICFARDTRVHVILIFINYLYCISIVFFFYLFFITKFLTFFSSTKQYYNYNNNTKKYNTSWCYINIGIRVLYDVIDCVSYIRIDTKKKL